MICSFNDQVGMFNSLNNCFIDLQIIITSCLLQPVNVNDYNHNHKHLPQVDPIEPGLRFLPFFYALTFVVNLFSIFYEGPKSNYQLINLSVNQFIS